MKNVVNLLNELNDLVDKNNYTGKELNKRRHYMTTAIEDVARLENNLKRDYGKGKSFIKQL